MKSLTVPLPRLDAGVSWTARVLSALLLGLIFVPIVVNCIYDVAHGFYEDGVPHALRVKGIEPIQMICFCTACIGMVVAWRWLPVSFAVWEKNAGRNQAGTGRFRAYPYGAYHA
jgi:hypothetical protein